MTQASHRRDLETQVWCIELAPALPALLQLDAASEYLPPEDRTRAARFADGDMARAWQGAHIALRLVLERLIGVEARGVSFVRSDRGKPHLTDSDVAFSLSHGAGRALIATGAQGLLGIDIEGPRAIRMSADRRQVIEMAGAAVDAEPLPENADSRFLQAWVRLEALSKATGEGMGLLLTRAGAFGPSRQTRVGSPLLANGLRVRDLSVGRDVFAAIALPASEEPAAVVHLPSGVDELRAFAQGAHWR